MILKTAGLSIGIIAAALLGAANNNTGHITTANADSTKAKVIDVKREAVKLYPNPSFDGTVTVSSSKTEKLHFYIFQQDGTLQHQAILKDKQKHTIQHLKKGVYTYDAFLNDESIEHGEIIVK